jgi:hypothetical protein
VNKLFVEASPAHQYNIMSAIRGVDSLDSPGKGAQKKKYTLLIRQWVFQDDDVVAACKGYALGVHEDMALPLPKDSVEWKEVMTKLKEEAYDGPDPFWCQHFVGHLEDALFSIIGLEYAHEQKTK